MLGGGIIALHAWWLIRSCHTGEVISAFGSALIALGLLIAAQPFVQAGFEGIAMQQVQAPHFPGYRHSGGMMEEMREAHTDRVKAAIPGIWAERIIGVTVILLGTLLNGYGAPIARLAGWRV